ncbi:diacylglycerol/lipid kinase family protein [Sphingomonas sp.]|uniref:diacylglycerol/lipid kinase family protein n=1 Tax=Sphingomonas sp. TaxID=28214 RepID=UPI003B009A58
MRFGAVTNSIPRSAALFVNGKSRKGRQQFKKACRLFREAGIELVEAHAVKKPADMPRRVAGAAKRGVPMVIVGGGDGTMSCTVDKIVGLDTVFAALPLGTANSFARTLGLPLDLAGAVKAIADGVPKRIDLGMIDDDYFANCATIGIAPQIAETVPHGLKSWLGRPGYLLWAARQLAAFRPFRVTIEQDGKRQSFEAVELRVANGRFHGGVELVDDAELTSGRIVVQAVIGHGRAGLVWSWLASVLRLPQRHAMTREFEGRSIRIETVPPLPISIDGEVLAETPVTAKVAARAITVAAPREPA